MNKTRCFKIGHSLINIQLGKIKAFMNQATPTTDCRVLTVTSIHMKETMKVIKSTSKLYKLVLYSKRRYILKGVIVVYTY